MKLSPTGIRAEERKARRNMYGIVAATQLEAMIAHAMHRVQTRWAFGVPIGEHLIQDKRVDMKVAMGSSRWLAYSKAAALIDHDPGFSVRASCTKLIASEGLVRAATVLIQIFGHAGYDRAGVIERYLRDAVVVRIAGGTTEMQKKNVFMSLMDSAPLAVPAGPARENRTDTTAVRLQRHGSAPTAA